MPSLKQKGRASLKYESTALEANADDATKW